MEVPAHAFLERGDGHPSIHLTCHLAVTLRLLLASLHPVDTLVSKATDPEKSLPCLQWLSCAHRRPFKVSGDPLCLLSEPPVKCSFSEKPI